MAELWQSQKKLLEILQVKSKSGEKPEMCVGSKFPGFMALETSE